MSKDITKSKKEIVYNKYNGRCAYCGIEINYNNFNIDHINPIRRDIKGKDRLNGIYGNNNIHNLNPSCVSCNCSKWSYSLEEWRNIISNKYNKLIEKEPSFHLLIRFNIVKINKKEVKFYFETHNG
jgi:5-methylcytosine-specific restriction endonuclease McrA